MAVMTNLIATHGYWIVAVVVGLESMGIPLPGETTLVSAAIYAGSTHHLRIVLIIAAAACGAIVGDNIGYWIGRRFGYRLLLRYGPLLRVTHTRVKVGQYLFQRHGGKVVFFGRFVALLRTLSALLAGINCMPWWRFLQFNLAGGILWAGVFGTAAYILGERIDRIRGPLSIAGASLGGVAAIAGMFIVRRREHELAAMAEVARPGPLHP